MNKMIETEKPKTPAKSLEFEVVAKCSRTKARAGVLKLPHACVMTPVFMPVGTQGTLKGLLPEQLEDLGCRMMLSNTYHLANKPGEDLLNKAQGLHNFMKWKHGLLTDSGGFQMVSLLKLTKVTEEGVNFKSPSDDSDMLLTPEKSIQVQNAIGADIIMQLDDVISSTTTGPRVEEAMHRSIRWLDRCIAAHQKPDSQSIFPIVQGGLDANLRTQCATEMVKRDVRGFAIGGLSGGEEKGDFWRMVDISTNILPPHKPRYLMGVGFAVDLVVCVALGCDMFDCVYPTRTARFGVALTDAGQMQLKHKRYKNDTRPISASCVCHTCRHHSRAYLHCLATYQPVAASLLTLHNVAYQLGLMTRIRESIIRDSYPSFVATFMHSAFPPPSPIPPWVKEALASVGINVGEVVDGGNGAGGGGAGGGGGGGCDGVGGVNEGGEK